jgi:hypothetical protein
MLSKTLATGVIILFFTISLNPVIVADDTDKNNMPSDNCREIITLIGGYGYSINLSLINKRGYWRGEAIISLGDLGGTMEFCSIGFSNSKIVFLRKNASYIHAYHFIGFIEMGILDVPQVSGIAVGNIDWYYEK